MALARREPWPPGTPTKRLRPDNWGRRLAVSQATPSPALGAPSLFRRLLVSVALVGSALVVPVSVTLPAAASAVVASAPAMSLSAACQYRRAGQTWKCVTPGAYCPAAARNKFGTAKVTNRRYKCSVYPNGQWRWKRA